MCCGGVANIGLKSGNKLRQGFACKQGIGLEAKLACDSNHSHVERKNRTQNALARTNVKIKIAGRKGNECVDLNGFS